MLKQTTHVAEYELLIKIEPQKTGGFVVRSTTWSDCYAQGDTVDEAILEITAVAQSLIELYKEEDLKIPLKLAKKSKVETASINVPVLVSA